MRASDSASTAPLHIGWREWVALPELGIAAIKAKVDTGARTSALHAFSVQIFDVAGARQVRFGIHPFQRRTDVAHYCTARVVDQRWVSDSGGHRERRIVIRTLVVIGGRTRRAELTLTDRDTMVFRMLLGRTALHGGCVIHPDASFLTGVPPTA